MSYRTIYEIYLIERRKAYKPKWPGDKPFSSLWHPVRAFRERDNAAEALQLLPRKETVNYIVEYQISTYYRVRTSKDDGKS